MTMDTPLSEHLIRHAGAPKPLCHLFEAIASASKAIQKTIQTAKGKHLGTINPFGEEQIELDVVSDKIIHKCLLESGVACALASEERENIVPLTLDAPYLVAIDPLDGSSLVDVDFAIGSIFGIYEGANLIGKTPAEQIAALYILYGPRTLLVYSTGKGVHAFLLNAKEEFVLLTEKLSIAEEAKTYSPGNLRAITDNAAYRSILNDWLDRALTLRYSGCMVADIHHIFAKGQGIFTNVGGSTYPEGKLRLVFECGPLAFLAHHAGGSASDGTIPILQKTIEHLNQRTPILLGSANEVNHVAAMLAS